MTAKTWAVVVVLALQYGTLSDAGGGRTTLTMAACAGISFWPVPFFSTIQSEMAVQFGSPAQAGAW